MYPLFGTRVVGLPIELKWLVMKVAVILRFCKFFTYDRNKRPVVKIANMVISRARSLGSMVEGDRDGDWSSNPPGVLVHPFCVFFVIAPIKNIGCQLRINFRPICLPYILRSKLWIANNTQKLVKAFTRFLDSMVPMPVC